MSDAQLLAAGKQIAQCIRENGVPTFPDPTVDNGQLVLPDDAKTQMEATYSKDVLDQAQHACQSLMDQLPDSAIRDSNGDENMPGPQDVDALRQFAACVRQHGIPEWPDPKADGTFPVAGTPLANEGKSPRMVAAMKECHQYWDGGIAFS